MLKSKKAISPILATLLLIVIAVAAIVVTYAWIMTYMGSSTQQAGVLLYKENVRFYGTPTDAKNRTEITIGNQGTGSTQIVTVYLGTSSGSMMNITSYTDVGSGKALNAGSTTTITINWPNDVATTWQAGQTYYFRIAPKPGQGQSLEFQQAP
jgi:flagellin-like protein